MVEELEQVCRSFSDEHTEENSRYEMLDAAMSALSVFFTQSPSFLAHQRDMKLRKGGVMPRGCLV